MENNEEAPAPGLMCRLPLQMGSSRDGKDSRLRPKDAAPPRLQFSWGLANELHVCRVESPSGRNPQQDAGAGHSASNNHYQNTNGFKSQGSKGMNGTSGSAQEQPGGTTAAFQVTWGPFRDADERHLAAESLPLFCELHSESDSESVYGGRSELVQDWSRRMGALLATPDEAGAAAKDDRPAEPSRLQRQVAHAVWTLVDIMYLDRGDASVQNYTEALADWLTEHDAVLTAPGGITVAARLARLRGLLISVERPEEHSEYWACVAAAASLGWLSTSISLLRLHSSYHDDQILEREDENGLVEAVAVLLGTMPRMRSHAATSVPPPGAAGGFASSSADFLAGQAFSSRPEFNLERDRWLGRLARLEMSPYWGQCGNARTVQGLQQLVRLLMGGKEALGGATCHFLERLVSRLLHLPPRAAGREGLRMLAQQCHQQLQAGGGPPTHSSRGPSRSSSPFAEDGGGGGGGGGNGGGVTPALDSLLMAALCRDTEALVSQTSRKFNSWFSAHVMEVLLEGGPHERQLLEQERAGRGQVSLLELYRLQYAEDLLSHSATWQMAPPYLAMCPTQGRGILEAAVTRQPLLASCRLPYKALEVCHLYGLDEAASLICTTMGMHHWQRGARGAAMCWLKKAANQAQLAALADSLLKEAVDLAASGDDPSLEDLGLLLDSLGPHDGSPSSLAFLHKYQKLRTLLRGFQVQQQQQPGGAHGGARQVARQEELRAAGKQASALLLEVLAAAPSDLFISLLEGSVALLEWPGGALVGPQETRSLMWRLQDFSQHPHPHPHPHPHHLHNGKPRRLQPPQDRQDPRDGMNGGAEDGSGDDEEKEKEAEDGEGDAEERQQRIQNVRMLLGQNLARGLLQQRPSGAY